MSLSVSSILGESRTTIRLAIPLIIGQLGQMLIGLSDTLMLGWLGVTELAASAFANTIIYLPMMVGIGMSMAVSIRVSQARGANDPVSARAALRHGLYITLGLGLLTVALAFALLPFLKYFGQDPKIIEIIPNFFILIAVSMIPAMGSMAVKSHADAMNRPWPMFWISIGAVFLDILLNWMLIFGKLGAPALGLEGAAISTIISRALSLICMIVWCIRDEEMKEWVPVRWLRAPDWEAVRDLVRTGLPASMQLLAEVSAFVAATFIIGNMGKAALASHQIAITCAATIFMIPLGISMALTVRIGEAFGAKNWKVMRTIVTGGWAMGIAFTVLSASAFIFLNRQIAALFIEGPDAAEVLDVAAALLVVAAVFQFCDALQIISAGALRGLDDVHTPAWIAFWAYWVVSIPLGWVLAHPLGWGVTGMWWGITVGLTMTSILLGRRIWKKTAMERAIDVQEQGGMVSES